MTQFVPVTRNRARLSPMAVPLLRTGRHEKRPLTAYLLLAGMLLPMAALAQQARLSGTVTDTSGAAIPGATVTVNQTEQNISFKANSDTEGQYLFPRLPIGSYEVKAEASGFKTFVQTAVVLTTSADASVGITMQIGSMSEQISVSAQASRVSTETATIAQLVDDRRIVDLPLNGRNVMSLATLVPGTGQSGTNIDGGRSGSQNSGMANIRLDGALNVDNVWQQALPSPSPDAVQEFTTQISSASARYGYAAGVIEISTKSGTNNLHGTIYEFLRNQDLDARNFFLAAKTNRKRNEYGFTAGGPVYVPKLYNGRNRTFWFVNFEQQKEVLGLPTTIYVPTAAQLSGNFSSTSAAIKDPSTNQPFPGNQIPASRLDPLALNFAKAYLPAARSANGAYVYQKPNGNNPTQLLARGDEILGGGKHQINFRVFSTRTANPVGSGTIPIQQNGKGTTNTDLYGLTYVALVSPTKVNTFHISLNHWYQFNDYSPKPTLQDLQQLGFSSNYYTYVAGLPTFAVSGFFQSSIDQIYITRDYHTLAWSDDFSWLHGKHNIQIGHDGIKTYQTDNNLSRTDGSFSFNGTLSGNAVSDFLIGRPVQFYQENPAPDHTRQMDLSFYVQDDYRASSRLTLNFGLRYELPLPTVALNYAVAAYRPGVQSVIYPTAPQGLLFWGDPGVTRSGTTTATKCFEPRVGLAYTLTSDNKTVVRAAYGIYHNPNWSNEAGQFAIYQPFTRRITLNTPPRTSNPWANYPGGNPFPSSPSLAQVGYSPGLKVAFDQDITEFAYGPDFKELTMQQWNINVQRELAPNLLLTVGYAGSHTTHIPYLQDINVPVYTPGQSTVGNTDQRRPLYPAYGRFLQLQTVTNGNYNPLLVSLDKRFTHSFSLQLAYTFSKALGDEDTVLTNTGGATNPFNRRVDYGPLAFDVSHAFVFSGVWNVPAGTWNTGAKGFVFGNWQVNGMWTMYSGMPVLITSSVDRALYGLPNRPDQIANPVLSTSRPRGQLRTAYFNTAAFAANQPGEFGTAPRAESQLRAPGSVTINVSLFKSFRGFREADKVQFRAESFNLLNRPNFGQPNSNFDGACFGCLTSAADGRLNQLALKYLF